MFDFFPHVGRKDLWDVGPPSIFHQVRTISFKYLKGCAQENEKNREKWECGSQVSLGDNIMSF